MSLFGPGVGLFGPGSTGTAEAAGPDGYVSAVTTTGFTVTIKSVTTLAGSTIYLETRGLGTVTAWTPQASSATPTTGATLVATGLTQDSALEWRLRESDGSESDDGRHGIVTPSASPWATLISTVGGVLLGLNFGCYYGNAPLDSHGPLAAVIREGVDSIAERGNNILTRVYPVELELRIRSTSPTGAQHFTDAPGWQRQIVAAFNERTSADYAGIPGLEVIRVETRETDGPARGKGEGYTNEARSTLSVQFYVNEAR